MAQKHHTAMMPSPGMGHLIPLVEFAKQLVLRHQISVTFIVPSVDPVPQALKPFLEGLPQGMDYVLLPPIHFDDGDKLSGATKVFLTVVQSLPSVRDVIKSLVADNTRLSAFFVDMFGMKAFDIAREFNIPPYTCFLSPASSLSLLFYLPKLDQMYSCEFRDVAEPITIPGYSMPINGRDLPDAIQDRNNEAYKLMLDSVKQYSSAEGIIINTFLDLEQGTIKALQEAGGSEIPPIYPIGPLITTASGEEADESECIKWLDDQPSGSVLFVSFGSGGTLSVDQLNELALGLELSEHRFLWVVRKPDDKSATASFFNPQTNADPLTFLPPGFLERTKERGLVVPSWAPQIQVLSHRSTGGFLTHCGWNSTLESIFYGVPLIAWPLYAEQKVNALVLSEDLKIALRPKACESGLVVREEIAKTVKCLMGGEEGEIILDRMKKLQQGAAMALSEDGSSTKAISELVLKLKNQ